MQCSLCEIEFSDEIDLNECIECAIDCCDACTRDGRCIDCDWEHDDVS
jgi:hypothetical protein